MLEFSRAAVSFHQQNISGSIKPSLYKGEAVNTGLMMLFSGRSGLCSPARSDAVAKADIVA